MSVRRRLQTTAIVVVTVLVVSCGRQEPGSSSAPGASGQNLMKSQDDAARKAMEALPALVTAENFGAMGFASPEEARSAVLGAPVPLRTVSYSKLLEYQPGVPLAQLFDGPLQLVYPVIVGQTPRSAIVVAQQAEGWRIASVGYRYYASLLEQMKSPPALPSETPTGGRTTVSDMTSRQVEFVSVPGINVDLLSFGEGDQRFLQPVRGLPEAGLEAGRALHEQEALTALSGYAKAFDRKYGDAIRKRRLVD
ncbi:MAG TPA: hypothetical protein VF139_02905 [Candidatus Polarisedimenticolaceae bacterium]